jgi:hypothetical protein
MAISPDYYPPFDRRELPANPSPRMQTALQALYLASVEVHRTLYRLVLLYEITRSPEVVRRVNDTALAYPMLTIRSGLAYSAVMSIYAVFDTDDGAASIRKVLSALADRREEDGIRQLHGPGRTGLDAEAVIGRLRRLQRRLNRGEISAVVGRLRDLRNQQLAHFDLNPRFDRGAPKMIDMDRAFVFAANVVNTATLAVVKRLLKTHESYEDARKQARDFTAALIRGPAKVIEH